MLYLHNSAGTSMMSSTTIPDCCGCCFQIANLCTTWCSNVCDGNDCGCDNNERFEYSSLVAGTYYVRLSIYHICIYR